MHTLCPAGNHPGTLKVTQSVNKSHGLYCTESINTKQDQPLEFEGFGRGQSELWYLLVDQIDGAANVQINKVDITVCVDEFCTLADSIGEVTSELTEGKSQNRVIIKKSTTEKSYGLFTKINYQKRRCNLIKNDRRFTKFCSKEIRNKKREIRTTKKPKTV